MEKENLVSPGPDKYQKERKVGSGGGEEREGEGEGEAQSGEVVVGT